MSIITAKGQFCEEKTTISHHVPNSEYKLASGVQPDKYMNQAGLSDHDPEYHCDMGSSHYYRPKIRHKLSHLTSRITSAKGHKDRIQKNDVHDILSYADYKIPPELVIHEHLITTCFALGHGVFSMSESSILALAGNLAGSLAGSLAESLVGVLMVSPTEKLLQIKSSCMAASVMKYIQEQTIIDMLKHNQVLKMSHNHIKDFEIKASEPLEYLRHMDLSDNLISEFHVNMSSMKNLDYLDLSSNKLSSLSSTTISQLNEIAALHDKKTLTIDIGGNNLLCTCDTMDFVKWVLHSHPTNIMFVNSDHYTCTDRYSKQVTLHDLSLFALIVGCYKAYLLYVVIVIIIIVVSVYAYKRRYQLRHLWYKIRKRCQHRDYNQQQHKYDAFVCFHRDDSNWIESEVRERLKHFKIVYGEEEVEFGESLPNVISKYIKESRRSILILSPSFVYSPNNSMFYANLIRENLMDTGNDTVIVVELKPLNRVGLDRTLAELMEHQEDNQDAQAFFWERLVDALQHPCEELYDTPENDRTGLLHP